MPASLEQAITLYKQNHLKDAHALLVKILDENPNNSAALHYAGLIANRLDDSAAAIQLLSKAEKLNPGELDRHIALAQSYRKQQQLNKALQHINQAITLTPASAANHVLHGVLLSDIGKLDDAVTAFEQALALNPNEVSAYFGLSRLSSQGHYTFSQAQRHRLLLLTQAEHLPGLQRSQACFTVAVMLHKENNYPAAFKHYMLANSLEKQTHTGAELFQPERHAALLHKTRSIFTSQLLAKFKGHASHSKRPVFIIGMPRTGSTLVEKILASHQHINAYGELAHIKNIARNYFAKATSLTYPDLINHLPAKIIPVAARYYLSKVSTNPDKHLRITDKMPTNYEMLGVIQMLFPNAFVIHTQRDPMDTLWSCFQQPIAAKYTNDFSDLIAKYRQYRQYMQLWRERLSINILDINYEDLVYDFSGKAHQLISFLELDWDPECLRFHNTQTGTVTASQLQVSKPIYSSSVGAWKHYAAELKAVRAELDEFY